MVCIFVSSHTILLSMYNLECTPTAVTVTLQCLVTIHSISEGKYVLSSVLDEQGYMVAGRVGDQGQDFLTFSCCRLWKQCFPAQGPESRWQWGFQEVGGGSSGDSRAGWGWSLSTRGLGNRDIGFCVWSLVGRWGRWEEWDVTPFCMCRLQFLSQVCS